MRDLRPPLCPQVMWLPNRQRPFVRKVAPGFQQTSGSKEAASSLRRGHIQWLNLRYTQVSRQELRCPPHHLRSPEEGQAESLRPATLARVHTPGQWLETRGLRVQRGNVTASGRHGLVSELGPRGGESLLGTGVRVALCSPGFPEAQTHG